MPMSRPLTIEDFEVIRDAADDGHRYELIDGSLIVTPSPTWLHQRVSSRLIELLILSNPDRERFEVLHAPFDVRPGGPTNLQPDPMVFTDAWVESPAATARGRDPLPQHPAYRHGLHMAALGHWRDRALLGHRP